MYVKTNKRDLGTRRLWSLTSYFLITSLLTSNISVATAGVMDSRSPNRDHEAKYRLEPLVGSNKMEAVPATVNSNKKFSSSDKRNYSIEIVADVACKAQWPDSFGAEPQTVELEDAVEYLGDSGDTVYPRRLTQLGNKSFEVGRPYTFDYQSQPGRLARYLYNGVTPGLYASSARLGAPTMAALAAAASTGLGSAGLATYVGINLAVAGAADLVAFPLMVVSAPYEGLVDRVAQESLISGGGLHSRFDDPDANRKIDKEEDLVPALKFKKDFSCRVEVIREKKPWYKRLESFVRNCLSGVGSTQPNQVISPSSLQEIKYSLDVASGALEGAGKGRAIEANISAVDQYLGQISPEYSDTYGRSPLQFAARAGHTQILTTLVKKNGFFSRKILNNGNYNFQNTTDSEGRPLIHHAILGGSRHSVKWLLENGGAQLKKKDKMNGWTALHLAAAMGRFDILTLLLESKQPLKLDQRDHYGKTFRHYVLEHLTPTNDWRPAQSEDQQLPANIKSVGAGFDYSELGPTRADIAKNEASRNDRITDFQDKVDAFWDVKKREKKWILENDPKKFSVGLRNFLGDVPTWNGDVIRDPKKQPVFSRVEARRAFTEKKALEIRQKLLEQENFRKQLMINKEIQKLDEESHMLQRGLDSGELSDEMKAYFRTKIELIELKKQTIQTKIEKMTVDPLNVGLSN